MIEIRIHGRGGQGNVVAAYLLASTAFAAGYHTQAFPAFGAERRGAPVVAFVRISKNPILLRSQVREPNYLIIQDPTLLNETGLLDGLKKGGGILINTAAQDDSLCDAWGNPMVSMPATNLAMEAVGRPVPNVALLSGFLTLTGIAKHAALGNALGERFKGGVLEKNLELVGKAAGTVPKDLWKEARDAARA